MLGPTAAGKSEVALELASRLSAPILSVDSMQVYREMDIGTAKPSRAERERVCHYLIDVVDPSEEYTVAEFQREGRAIIDHSGHDTLLVVGGSGLHFRSLVDPHTFQPHDPALRRQLEELEDPASTLNRLDPAAASLVDLANRRRVVRALEIHHLTGLTPSMRYATIEAEKVRRYQPKYRFVAVGLDPGPRLQSRVRARVEAMATAGLVDEVASLRGRLGRTAARAVGYRQLLAHLDGETTLSQAWEEVVKATLALARRQRTFFRRDPRISWLSWDEDPRRRIEGVAERWGLA